MARYVWVARGDGRMQRMSAAKAEAYVSGHPGARIWSSRVAQRYAFKPPSDPSPPEEEEREEESNAGSEC